MVSLDQAMITTIMADSRFVTAFPELGEARRRIATLTQKDTGGCCGGSSSAANTAVDIRSVLSWLKSTVANWSQDKITKFLTMIGQPVLFIAYNDPVSRTVVERIIRK